MKRAAKAKRDAIFRKPVAKEKARREGSEYVDNLRNDLQVQEMEEKYRNQEISEAQKRQRQMEEL